MQLDEHRGQGVGVLSQWLRPRETPGLESQPDRREIILAKRLELTQRRVALQDECSAAARLEQARKAETERQASEVRQILANTRETLEKLSAESFDAEGKAAQEERARLRKLRQIEIELEETADAQIPEFIREMQREADELTRTGLNYFEIRNRLTNERRMMSNGTQLNARLSAMRQAIQSAQDLRLEAVTADQVGARLQSLREGLPTEEGGNIDLGQAWQWERAQLWIAPRIVPRIAPPDGRRKPPRMRAGS